MTVYQPLITDGSGPLPTILGYTEVKGGAMDFLQTVKASVVKDGEQLQLKLQLNHLRTDGDHALDVELLKNALEELLWRRRVEDIIFDFREANVIEDRLEYDIEDFERSLDLTEREARYLWWYLHKLYG